MAGFLYLFPGCNGRPSNEAIKAADLTFLLDGEPTLSVVRCLNGPQGTAGAIVAIDKHAPKVGYYPDQQEWVMVTDAEGKTTHWLGWDKEHPPEPEDLVNCDIPEGTPVRMGDGNYWVIPLVRPLMENAASTLPYVMTMDAKGDVFLESLPEHRPLVEEAEWWVRMLIESNDGVYRWTLGRFMQYAILLLKVYYRVGRTEINALRLIRSDTHSQMSVVEASLGWRAVIEELEARSQKKTPEEVTPSST